VREYFLEIYALKNVIITAILKKLLKRSTILLIVLKCKNKFLNNLKIKKERQKEKFCKIILPVLRASP